MKSEKVLVHVVTTPLSLRFFHGQIAYMKNHDLSVHIVTSPGDLLVEFTNRESVVSHPIHIQREISPLADLISLWRIWRKFRDIQPSIVHAHTPKAGLLGMIAAFLARVPVRIFHVHGIRSDTLEGIKKYLVRYSEKLTCALATQILSVSNSTSVDAIEKGLCSSHKIKVLGNGSINGIEALSCFNPDLNKEYREIIRLQMQIPLDAFVIGFVGRISREKGILELTYAWKSLSKEFPHTHLLVVGPDESEAGELKAFAELKGRDSRIHLTGLIPKLENMPHYYASMDVLAFPTYREGFGLVAAEASAMALPVVATKIPGCIDVVVDGVTGTLINVNDANALAEALRAYVVDPDVLAEHGKAGRERILRDFQPEKIWQATYDTYKYLLKKYED